MEGMDNLSDDEILSSMSFHDQLIILKICQDCQAIDSQPIPNIEKWEKKLDRFSLLLKPQSELEEAKEMGIPHLLYNRLPVMLDKVMIQPSRIHGNGVFATRDIAADEVVTMYPADYVLQINASNPESNKCIASSACLAKFNNKIPFTYTLRTK
jgi:hypothetical protein